MISCDKKSKVEKAVEQAPAVEIKVERFDKLFFETPPQDLAKLKKEFPFFFPPGNDDSIWTNKMKDPIWRELYAEVQKKYANERDKQVLLIDADVARPSVSKTLGIEYPIGLIDYLENDDIAYADIEVKTNMPGLTLITAGKLHKHSTELLSSNKMAAFAEELSNRYPDRIVIFDSPPLLAATQGDVLAKLVGQIVLVIEAERTLQSMVKASVDKLAACEVVLAVLNKTKMGLVDSYYGYGYGYGRYGHK